MNYENRILDKLDSIENKISSIEVVQVEVRKDLNEHMRRTKLLEESLKPVRRAYDSLIWISGIALFVVSVFKFWE